MEKAEVGSSSVATSARGPRFTLKKANSTLPLVSRIAQDVVSLHAQIATIRQRLAGDTLTPSVRQGLEFEAMRQDERFDGLLAELRDVGCELKDAQMGLVDFVGTHDGRDVCLCWKLGEERIEYWHEVDAGFAGRHPISGLRET